MDMLVGELSAPNSSRLKPDSSYREIIDNLYYHGADSIGPTSEEIVHYHDTGHGFAPESSEFIELLTERLAGLLAYEDIHNSLVVLLADLIDKDARNSEHKLCPNEFGRKWGTSASDTLRRVLATDNDNPHQSRPKTGFTQNELVRFISLFTPERIEEYISGDPIPLELPLIEKTSKRLGKNPKFHGMFALQHLMGSTAALIRAIQKDLLDSGATYLLGKPYSTSQSALWAMRRYLNAHVDDASWEYTGIHQFEFEVGHAIERLFDRFIVEHAITPTETDRRFLLLDDGGKLIKCLHSEKYRKYAHLFSCVEQTRRGARIVRQLNLQCPVVNVAESRAKLVHESPLIADSVIDEMQKKLDDLVRIGVPITSPIGVIGMGSIGCAVAISLVDRGWDVYCFDGDKEKLEQATQNQPFHGVDKATMLGKCKVIVGCTGETALTIGEFPLLQDCAVLVSASSSDVEFEGWKLRAVARQFSGRRATRDRFNLLYEQFGQQLLLLGDEDHPCHMLNIATWNGKKTFLVNGGFPVNFDGSIDPITPHKIQLTRALLYAGCWQAANEQSAGLLDMSDELQDFIIDGYYELNSETRNLAMEGK